MRVHILLAGLSLVYCGIPATNSIDERYICLNVSWQDRGVPEPIALFLDAQHVNIHAVEWAVAERVMGETFPRLRTFSLMLMEWDLAPLLTMQTLLGSFLMRHNDLDSVSLGGFRLFDFIQLYYEAIPMTRLCSLTLWHEYHPYFLEPTQGDRFRPLLAEHLGRVRRHLTVTESSMGSSVFVLPWLRENLHLLDGVEHLELIHDQRL
jgi:hypothetical protein